METYPEKRSRMEPRADVSEDLHHQVKLDSTLTEVKSEPENSEGIGTIRTTPDSLYVAVDIKAEQLGNNNPKLILPDWSCVSSESASETEEDRNLFVMDTEKEDCSTKLVDRKNLSSEDEESLDTSVEIEDFCIKEEPEHDLFLSVDVEERNENQEVGRGRQPEVMSEIRTDLPQSGDLFNVQNEFMSRLQCDTELKRKKVQELQCNINSFHTGLQYIPQSVSLYDHEAPCQVQGKDETFKRCKQTDKQNNCQEVISIHNKKQDVQTAILKVKHCECQQCGKRFYDKGTMRKHVQTVHQKMKQFACQHCGQKFGQCGSMKQHVQSVHLKETAIECQHCGKKFARNGNMIRHVQTVHQKMKHFVCQYCGMKFARNGNMRKHVQTVHQKMKHFVCQYCGRKFGQHSTVKQHVETVHLQKKLFECQHCGQKFGHGCSMKQHVEAVHLKEKQFECQHCGKKFVRKQNMKKHIQTVHMKDKLFVCQHCGQKFGYSCSMKEHVQSVHLKETEFECQHWEEV